VVHTKCDLWASHPWKKSVRELKIGTVVVSTDTGKGFVKQAGRDHWLEVEGGVVDWSMLKKFVQVPGVALENCSGCDCVIGHSEPRYECAEGCKDFRNCKMCEEKDFDEVECVPCNGIGQADYCGACTDKGSKVKMSECKHFDDHKSKVPRKEKCGSCENGKVKVPSDDLKGRQDASGHTKDKAEKDRKASTIWDAEPEYPEEPEPVPGVDMPTKGSWEGPYANYDYAIGQSSDRESMASYDFDRCLRYAEEKGYKCFSVSNSKAYFKDVGKILMPADLEYKGHNNRNVFWLFSHEDPSDGHHWTCDDCGADYQQGKEYRCQTYGCNGVRPHDSAPRRAGFGKHRDGIPMPVEDDEEESFNKKPKPGCKRSQNKKDDAQYKAGDKVMVKDFTRHPMWHEDGMIMEVFVKRKGCTFMPGQKFDVGSLHVAFSGGEVMIKPAQQMANLKMLSRDVINVSGDYVDAQGDALSLTQSGLDVTAYPTTQSHWRGNTGKITNGKLEMFDNYLFGEILADGSISWSNGKVWTKGGSISNDYNDYAKAPVKADNGKERERAWNWKSAFQTKAGSPSGFQQVDEQQQFQENEQEELKWQEEMKYSQQAKKAAPQYSQAQYSQAQYSQAPQSQYSQPPASSYAYEQPAAAAAVYAPPPDLEAPVASCYYCHGTGRVKNTAWFGEDTVPCERCKYRGGAGPRIR